ncbi:hypothetical protein [Leucobacter chromiiresistens]|uniref:Uncharacterized protein n=1 Tax=Leucobacter chromiiresistens TaxID=1079994 RepID=A0A1H1BCJ3_9MICO|nr:hypothetical protein [Leucobacter chromiiresistens]SDQ49694.1 hypothetical protein SAMN04488565_2734 [Leucobacter chromiiresistens]
MITTPYKQLRDELGKPEEWRPSWAQHLEVRRHGERTIYSAKVEHLTADQLEELHALGLSGWDLRIDSPALNRLRIALWRTDERTPHA